MCSSSNGCELVANSSYARPFGMPLPLLGVGGYLLLLITACQHGRRALTAGMVLTMAAIGVSVTLTFLELSVIHAICYWCVASAICAALHVVVNSTRYVRGDAQQRAAPA